MSEANIITVKILDREYKIKCPAEQAQELQAAAAHVDDQMKKLRQNSNITSTDRIAVVAALNICHEWMLLKKQKNQHIDEMGQRIQMLQKKIENFLAANEEITV